MKMIFVHTALLLSAILSSVAVAQSGDNCVIFNKTDMQGDKKAIMASSDDFTSSAGVLDENWAQKIKSIWVKNGYILETYSAGRFGGTLTTFVGAPSDGRYRASSDGFYTNVSDLLANQPIASYRCRAQGAPLVNLGICSYCALHSYNNVVFKWIGGGNHPNHSSVEIRDVNGQRTLRTHDDYTYGIYKNDFVLNLDTGAISIKLDRDRDVGAVEETLQKPARDEASVATRLAYYGAIKYMTGILSRVAKGADMGNFVQPPKPELKEWEDTLDSMSEYIFHE